jgi:protein SCO1/2
VLFVLLISGCAQAASEGVFSGLEVDRPQTMPDPVLIDTQGQSFSMRADTKGAVRLVYFGFTSCPDICPVHLSQLSDVLARPGMPPNIKVLFVTVDPDNDTPQVMRSFLDQFSSEFIGLTGTKERLLEVQRQFSALIATSAVDENGEAGDIGHDGRVFAFAPDDLGRTQYPHPTRQTTWTRDLPILATLR